MTQRDNRSPVWGGGTIGLLIGLIVGIFRDPFLDTVLWGVGIGVVVGASAGLLGWVSDVMRRRRYRG